MSSHSRVRTTTTTKEVTHARTILQHVTERTHSHTTSSTPTKLQMNNNEVILTLSHANMFSLSHDDEALVGKAPQQLLPSSGPVLGADWSKHVGVLAAIGGAATTTTTSSAVSPAHKSFSHSLKALSPNFAEARTPEENNRQTSCESFLSLSFSFALVLPLSEPLSRKLACCVFRSELSRRCLRQTFAQVRAWVAGCRVLGAPIIIINSSSIRRPSLE